MTKKIFALLISVVSLNFTTIASASGAGSSGGLSLLSEGNARAAALGQAYTASYDDSAGMLYNPASLTTLQSGQASFLYQQGLIQDNIGQLTIGSPTGKNSALGFAFGYYNGGKIELTDANTGNTKNVNAQTDMSAALGYAHNFGGLSVGLNGKVLRSTLLENVTATAYAADFGLMMPFGSRVRLGASALNYGTELKYVEAGDSLPRMLRAGMAFLLIPGRNSTTLLMDVPYMVNEKITTPSVGLETMVGPMALRAGYRTGNNMNELTLGAGFTMGRSSLDYAFGMVNQLDAQHKISFAMKFGGPSTPSMIVRKPVVNNERVVSKPQESKPVARNVTEQPTRMHTLGGEQIIHVAAPQRRVYMVKEGDTLATIAQSELGDKRQWKAIYSANKHLIDDPSKIEKGMRIIIPD